MADDIRFGLGVNPAGLTSGLAAAQAAIRAAGTKFQTAMKPVQGAFDQATAGAQRFSGVIGGISIAAFAASMRSTISDIAALDDASEQTGASVEELSSLLNTLSPSGVSLDTITTAMGRLTKAMTNADDETKGAGEAFDLLGVKTRDAAGNLRPAESVLQDVARALDTYKDGSNKTALAIAIFGKSGAQLLPMLKDLANTTREAATVTTEQAAAAEKAEKSLNRLGREMTNLRQEAANELVPALIEVLNKLRSIATISGSPVKWWRYLFGEAGDINAEVARIEADIKRLQGVVERGGTSTNSKNSANPALGSGLLGQMFGSDEARASLLQLQRDLQEARAVQAAQRRMGVSTAQAPRSGRALIYDDSGYGPAPDKDDAPATSDKSKDTAAAALRKRQEAALAGLDMQIAKEKELSEVEQMRIRTTTGDYKDFSVAVKARLMLGAAEIDQQKLLEATVKAATEAEQEDLRGMADLKRQALADLKRQNEELDRAAEKWKELADPTVKYTKQLQEIRALLAKGRLTPDQALSAEFAVENARQDEIDNPLGKIEPPTWLGTVEGGFRRLFDAIKEGSLSMRSVWQGALGVMGDIATNAFSKIASDWLVNMVVGKVAAIKTAFSDISASAARAGAAAFASTAAIPIIGPGLAPAAGAAAYSGAMSFASGLAVASAARGFDIPAGINPVTQLHAREMVLPEKHADVIRGLAGAAGGGGTGGARHVHVHAVDAPSVDRLFMDNRRGLERAARSLWRSGAFSRG